MKKINVSSEKPAMLSHGQVTFINLEQEREYASSFSSGTFVIPNRLGVEIGKILPASGSHMTSNVVFVVNDLGSESFFLRTASSQTGIAKFRETRLLSPAAIKQRTMKALKRDEERRGELLRQEENIKNET